MTPENGGGEPTVTLKVKLMKLLVLMKSSVMSLKLLQQLLAQVGHGSLPTLKVANCPS